MSPLSGFLCCFWSTSRSCLAWQNATSHGELWQLLERLSYRSAPYIFHIRQQMAERRGSGTRHMGLKHWPETVGFTAKVLKVEIFYVVNAECSYLIIRSGDLVCNQWLGGTPAHGILSTRLKTSICFHPVVPSPEKPRWSRQHIHDSG